MPGKLSPKMLFSSSKNNYKVSDSFLSKAASADIDVVAEYVRSLPTTLGISTDRLEKIVDILAQHPNVTVPEILATASILVRKKIPLQVSWLDELRVWDPLVAKRFLVAALSTGPAHGYSSQRRPNSPSMQVRPRSFDQPTRSSPVTTIPKVRVPENTMDDIVRRLETTWMALGDVRHSGDSGKQIIMTDVLFPLLRLFGGGMFARTEAISDADTDSDALSNRKTGFAIMVLDSIIAKGVPASKDDVTQTETLASSELELAELNNRHSSVGQIGRNYGFVSTGWSWFVLAYNSRTTEHQILQQRLVEPMFRHTESLYLPGTFEPVGVRASVIDLAGVILMCLLDGFVSALEAFERSERSRSNTHSASMASLSLSPNPSSKNGTGSVASRSTSPSLVSENHHPEPPTSPSVSTSPSANPSQSSSSLSLRVGHARQAADWARKIMIVARTLQDESSTAAIFVDLANLGRFVQSHLGAVDDDEDAI
ncbi:hypothetical protein DFS34DRAFT_626888 [Phlyctochytrium arcticum]|nr:hypothetical protein DFS34DRAFT_626888 [Phlyctochytrium arcticum]